MADTWEQYYKDAEAVLDMVEDFSATPRKSAAIHTGNLTSYRRSYYLAVKVPQVRKY